MCLQAAEVAREANRMGGRVSNIKLTALEEKISGLLCKTAVHGAVANIH